MTAARNASKLSPSSRPAALVSGLAKSAREMAAKPLADLLGIDVGTLRKDMKTAKGFPIVRESKGRGHDAVLDIAAVHAFKVEEAFQRGLLKGRAEGRLAASSGDDDGDYDPEKLVTLATKQLKLMELQKALAQVEVMSELWRRGFGLIRHSVMALPEKIIRLFPGLPDQEVEDAMREIRELCISCLEEGNQAILDATDAQTSA